MKDNSLVLLAGVKVVANERLMFAVGRLSLLRRGGIYLGQKEISKHM